MSVMGAYSPTFAATVGRQNHVEMIHLCQHLEEFFHIKRWPISGRPSPPLGKFLLPMQFFPTFSDVGIKWVTFQGFEGTVHTVHPHITVGS